MTTPIQSEISIRLNGQEIGVAKGGLPPRKPDILCGGGALAPDRRAWMRGAQGGVTCRRLSRSGFG